MVHAEHRYRELEDPRAEGPFLPMQLLQLLLKASPLLLGAPPPISFPHSCSGHVLLLLRNSKHNDKTWGLPGGNSENDETLLQTAVREAGEEMGPLPAGYEVRREVLTRWGRGERCGLCTLARLLAMRAL